MPERCEEYAVVLNRAARRVNDRVMHELADVVPPHRLHLVTSFEESDEVSRHLMHRGVGTVFTGGGDGTVTHFVDRALRLADAENAAMPDVGILRLGTGNALAEMVSSRDFLCDIKNFVGNPHRDVQLLPLVTSEGRRFAFGGLGWDAELLNDYGHLKQRLDSGALEPLVQSVGGYFAALFAYTVPRRLWAAIRDVHYEVRIINTGAPAQRLDSRGRVVDVIATGDTLYEGPANCVLFGTCPFYGYGMKVLPWAQMRPDRMQLRVATMSLGGLLRRLPSVWRGKYNGPGMHDMLVQSVRLELATPMPYQETGDARGWRESVDVGLANESVRLLRFI